MRTGRGIPAALAAVVVATLLAAVAAAAPFTPGNVVVYRVGDGGAALSGSAAAVFLDEYAANGTLVQSIALPTAVSGAHKRVTASGTAGSDGLLGRSVDGRYLLATGYDVAPATAGVVAGSSARVVGRVYADGTIDSTTALTDAATTPTNFRSAASVDGSAFWVTGGTTTAVRYATLGATTSTQLLSTPSNFRFVSIAANQLYVSTGTGTRLMATIGTGLPTTATQTATNLPGLPTTTSVYNQHFFADLNAGVAGVDTLYIADENAGVGLIKYSLVAGTWVSNGSLGGGSYAGLTGVVSGGNVVLYATRNGNELVTFTDTSGHNGAFAGTVTSLKTAAANTAFRGVAMAPQVSLTVTPTAGAHGTISPSTPQSVYLGTKASFTVTPDAGYSALVGGTCGGSLVGNTYTTNTVLADCSVSVTFTLIPTYTVTPSAGAGGSISPNTPQTVLSGATKAFTVTPAPGFTASVGGTCGGALVAGTYTTDAIVADCTVAATFTPITYSVTPSAGAHGTISPDTAQVVNAGATAAFTVTPDAGYSASVGGTCGGALVASTYTTNPVTGDCTVSATFAPLPAYTVTPSVTAHGSVSPGTPQSVLLGSTASFTIAPDAGYSTAVRGTCGGSFTGNVWTTKPITADCTVVVAFSSKLVLFLGNSYTFGRVNPVMQYNTGNVTDLTYQMWLDNPNGSNEDEPHPWGGIPGVFKKFTEQAGLDYDVSISARNAASLRGHFLNSNPAGWDLRGNAASQKWDVVVLQDLSDEPLPAGRSANANLPYFNAYADKFEAWIHAGAAESYTETQLFGGGNVATCQSVTGASASACNALRTISPANANANPATDIYLYQTWARPDMIAPNGTNANGTYYTAAEGLEAMTADFHDSYFGRFAANGKFKGVSPVGDAFLRAVVEGVAMRDPYVPEPGKINLWHTDYFHPSKYGSYLSALVHFARITGIDPTTLGAGELAAIDLGIASADAVSLQQIAKLSVSPAAPTIGTAVAGAGQITIGFTPPSNVGGLPITGYTATCGGHSASGAASPIVVGGLANGVAATCTVTATNSVGTGVPSAASNSVTPATTPSAPTDVTATAGNGQVRVDFTPSASNGGADITGYTATCGAQSAGGNGSPIVVYGLANGTSVTCTVFATNAKGDSLPSAPSNSATPATVPDAPVIGTALGGNKQITVAFTPAFDGGSEITSYTATCGSKSAGGNASPIVVGGLVNNVSYTCTVVATNAVGPSAASAASNSVTPAGGSIPGVVSLVPLDPSPTMAGSVRYALTLSESITGLSASNFSVAAGFIAGASITGVEGSGSAYTITVGTGRGSGTLELFLVNGTGTANGDNNPLGGAFPVAGGLYAIDKGGTVLGAGEGRPDAAFGSGGYALFNVTQGVASPGAIAVRGNGSIVVAGGVACNAAGGADCTLQLAQYLGNGAPDAGFAPGGKRITTISGVDPDLAAVIVNADGSFFVAGTRRNGATSVPFVAKFASDGTPANGYGASGIASLSGIALGATPIGAAVDATGRVVVAGTTPGTPPQGTDVVVARLTATGALDPTFGSGGIATVGVSTNGARNDYGSDVAVQPNGKIVIGGRTLGAGGYDYLLLRLNPNGGKDNGFGNAGAATLRFAGSTGHNLGRKLALQPDGKVVLAGAVDTAIGTQCGVARFNGNGSPDAGFGDGGQVLIPIADGCLGATVQADGKIVAAAVDRDTDVTYATYVRMHDDGTPDAGFGTDGVLDISSYGAPPRVATTAAGNLVSGVVIEDSADGIRKSYVVQLASRLAAATDVKIVSIAPAATQVGQAYTVAVSVTSAGGVPGGTVEVSDGAGAACAIALSGGAGSCALASTSAGNRTVSATYPPTPGFQGGAATKPHNVTAASTVTILGASANPVPPGGAVTLAASVALLAPGAGTPVGTVTFRNGPATLGTAGVDGAGVATLVVATLPAGAYRVTADFVPAGDAFKPSKSAPLDLTVQAAPTVQFAASAVSVAEKAGVVLITVQRAGSVAGAASVTYDSIPGTATSPADFAAAHGTLTWVAGDAAAKTIAVGIVRDAVKEQEKAFGVVLSAPSGVALGVPAAVTVTIKKN